MCPLLSVREGLSSIVFLADSLCHQLVRGLIQQLDAGSEVLSDTQRGSVWLWLLLDVMLLRLSITCFLSPLHTVWCCPPVWFKRTDLSMGLSTDLPIACSHVTGSSHSPQIPGEVPASWFLTRYRCDCVRIWEFSFAGLGLLLVFHTAASKHLSSV